ncbi:MAG: hypothetical protein ACKO0M_17790 [Cyanobium sp.]
MNASTAHDQPFARPASESRETADQVKIAHADPEFIAWASEHERERRRHEADLAQITTHPDAHADGDALGQQRAWKKRQEQARHLHDSAIAQMRPVDPNGI